MLQTITALHAMPPGHFYPERTPVRRACEVRKSQRLRCRGACRSSSRQGRCIQHRKAHCRSHGSFAGLLSLITRADSDRQCDESGVTHVRPAWSIFVPMWMPFLSCLTVSTDSTGGDPRTIRGHPAVSHLHARSGSSERNQRSRRPHGDCAQTDLLFYFDHRQRSELRRTSCCDPQ